MKQKERLLENKVAWVTGGASGYGKCYAMRLAEEGCKVALCDLDEAEGKTVSEEIQKKFGVKVLFKKIDVRTKSEVGLFAKEVFEHFNGLHIAVNNAGVMGSSPFLELEEREWDRILDVNLKGCFLSAQAAAKVMVEHKIPGKIVNISSDAGVFAQPNLAHYSTSKAGVVMLTKVMAFELATYGIHVNCLCPGPAKTKGQMASLNTEDARKGLEERIARTPLGGRSPTFEEMANCLIFLVSSHSDYVTGDVLVVDGGFTAALR
jgi:NAD(P)-dependent dehydrogenase (short-subunit alcohol dehydrogenase family)